MRSRVEAAFAAVPRSGFLPESERPHASWDVPLPIGHGVTSSQPRTVADMLRLLDVGAGQRVLDVGSGSGWTTALLAWLVGPAGSVLGVERVAELVAWGSANLAATGMGWAAIVAAEPGVLGVPGRGPYDRVLVSAMADDLPDELVAQLVLDGVLVVPVGGWLLRMRRRGDGPPQVSRHGAYRFVPLVR